MARRRKPGCVVGKTNLMVRDTNIYESNIRNPNPKATVCKGDIFVCQPNICRKGNLEIVRVEKGKGEIIGIPSKNMERTLKKDPANGSRIFCEMVNESGKVVYYSIQGKGLNYANLEQKQRLFHSIKMPKVRHSIRMLVFCSLWLDKFHILIRAVDTRRKYFKIFSIYGPYGCSYFKSS